MATDLPAAATRREFSRQVRGVHPSVTPGSSALADLVLHQKSLWIPEIISIGKSHDIHLCYVTRGSTGTLDRAGSEMEMLE